jgi:hypothetical protein
MSTISRLVTSACVVSAGTTFAVEEELWHAASGLWSSARQVAPCCCSVPWQQLIAHLFPVPCALPTSCRGGARHSWK